MAIEAERVAVSTTAVVLASGGGNGCRVNIYNPGATVYLGGGGPGTLTTSTGRQLGSAESVGFYVEHDEILYGIGSSGTVTVQVLRGGVSS